MNRLEQPLTSQQIQGYPFVDKRHGNGALKPDGWGAEDGLSQPWCTHVTSDSSKGPEGTCQPTMNYREQTAAAGRGVRRQPPLGEGSTGEAAVGGFALAPGTAQSQSDSVSTSHQKTPASACARGRGWLFGGSLLGGGLPRKADTQGRTGTQARPRGWATEASSRAGARKQSDLPRGPSRRTLSRNFRPRRTGQTRGGCFLP